ncbi:hypothetical protein RchiOBHm_Chr3g0471761 [Rosa chinensis]|uniref:Uncharacterized protein n=1 Tax=Rosa chinensis TaxID=74649 RepID=A0A2P6RBF8_ROSCH|nr:hypothetical protein RchiOBHm_Chr3g0471761 [Rosa chinensis]
MSRSDRGDYGGSSCGEERGDRGGCRDLLCPLVVWSAVWLGGARSALVGWRCGCDGVAQV